MSGKVCCGISAGVVEGNGGRCDGCTCNGYCDGDYACDTVGVSGGYP